MLCFSTCWGCWSGPQRLQHQWALNVQLLCKTSTITRGQRNCLTIPFIIFLKLRCGDRHFCKKLLGSILCLSPWPLTNLSCPFCWHKTYLQRRGPVFSVASSVETRLWSVHPTGFPFRLLPRSFIKRLRTFHSKSAIWAACLRENLTDMKWAGKSKNAALFSRFYRSAKHCVWIKL